MLDELRQEKQLSVRFHLAYRLDLHTTCASEDLETIESGRKKYHDDWMDTNSVKMMLDGVIEIAYGRVAGTLYRLIRQQRGAIFWDLPSIFKPRSTELDKRDVQLFTHAIGDYAMRTALDAYELAEKKNHTKDHRPANRAHRNDSHAPTFRASENSG